MKKYLVTLHNCSLFDGISDSDLPMLLDCLGAKVEKFGKKNTIISEGSPAKHIGIVLSGYAQTVQLDYCGNRSIISAASPSETFCEAFACAGIDSVPVSVVAAEACEIMLLDSCRIMNSCTKACGFHRQMIFNLMKELAAKNIMFHRKIEITSARSTREKLLTYLVFEAKKNKRLSFTIPFNRQELADYLEVDRSGLSAEISKMRNEGILECNRSHFTLTDVKFDL